MRLLALTLVYYILPFASFANTYYGIVFYTFISVIRPEQLTWGIIYIKNTFLIAIITLLASCVVQNEKLVASIKQPFFIYFFLFTFNIYITTLISSYTIYDEAYGSFYYLKQMPQILCFCLCLYAVLSRLNAQQIDRYLLITLSFVTFMGLWGIQQFIGGNVGVEGLFGYDRCAVTSVFVLYLPLAVYFFKKKSLTKFFGAISILVCFIAIILTESRAGALGCLVVLGLMVLYSRLKVVLIPAICLLLALGVLIAPDGYFDRFHTAQTTSIDSGNITDYSSASRLLLWKVAGKIIIDHPFLGVGHLNFSKANRSYATDLLGTTDTRLFNMTFGPDNSGGLSHTHNTLLNILVEGGLVSLLPFVMLFIVPMWRGYKIARRYRDANNPKSELIFLMACGLAGFLVTGFFGYLMLIDYFYWNLTILYLLVINFEKMYPAKQL